METFADRLFFSPFLHDERDEEMMEGRNWSHKLRSDRSNSKGTYGHTHKHSHTHQRCTAKQVYLH